MIKMDKMNTPVNTYLDFSKAFDTLDHTILLQKLEYYIINGTSHKLMESYITNQKQYAEINDSKLTLITGISQSSILGPLLFIIYINDISQVSKPFDFIIYADDTILSTTIEIVFNNAKDVNVVSKLNAELAFVSDWLKINKLSLSIQRCKYLIFRTNRIKTNALQLIINNTIFERVYECNFLGLTLNEHLNWNTHINKISNKMSKSMGILKKMKHFLSQKKTINSNLQFINIITLELWYTCLGLSL